MTHDPSWHILDQTFTNQNEGITTPTRNLGGLGNDRVDVARTAEQQTHVNTLVISPFGLRISNLDRADPPGYERDGYPRGATFNRNVLRITAAPRMPPIRVQCQTLGFEPATTPIYWRLQVRHVLCRFTNVGQFRYRGVGDILEDQWQGRSNAADFHLFRDPEDTHVTYTYNTSGADAPVMGGHAILSVAARPPGSNVTLLDYVHLRIGGTNPTRAEVLARLDTMLASRNVNVLRMVRAIYAHEAGFRQFNDGVQTRSRMRFRPGVGHSRGQPDCPVAFDYPDDPANFPNAAFDYGVGISQYTRVGGQVMEPEYAWDWRENIKIGINLFFGKLRRTRAGNTTWAQWAADGWAAYNGSGDTAQRYSRDLQASAEGQTVSNDRLPANPDAEVVALPARAARANPPAWPPAAPAANAGQQQRQPQAAQ